MSQMISRNVMPNTYCINTAFMIHGYSWHVFMYSSCFALLVMAGCFKLSAGPQHFLFALQSQCIYKHIGEGLLLFLGLLTMSDQKPNTK